jgi:NTE family protein
MLRTVNLGHPKKPHSKTAIVLSAGYFGFYAHAGFMRAVEECGIEYSAISGSSAGALIASLHASGVPAEEIIESLLGARRRDLWDRVGAAGLFGALLRRGRGLTGMLKGDRFEHFVRRTLKVQTFAECPRRLYITALNLTGGVEETFTTGSIADKVRASCAYPLLMEAKTIAGQEYWDGGFLSKVPFETLLSCEKPARLIVHYLPSRSDDAPLRSGTWAAMRMFDRALSISRREIEKNRLAPLRELGSRLTLIEPDVPRLGIKDQSRAAEVVELAFQNARAALLKHDLMAAAAD